MATVQYTIQTTARQMHEQLEDTYIVTTAPDGNYTTQATAGQVQECLKTLAQ